MRLSLNENNLHIPCYKTSRLQHSIKYQGVTLWNSIPKEIQKLTTKTFKRKLKRYFIEIYEKPNHSNHLSLILEITYLKNYFIA